MNTQDSGGKDRKGADWSAYFRPGQTLAPFSIVYRTGPIGLRNNGFSAIIRSAMDGVSLTGGRGGC